MTLKEALGTSTTATQLCTHIVITVERDTSYGLPLLAVSLQYYGAKKPFGACYYSTPDMIDEDMRSIDGLGIDGFDAANWIN